MTTFTRSTLLILLSLCVAFTAGAVSASFTSDVISGCAPLTVNFTNTSIDATSYSWNFNNGNPPSTQTNPSATFLTPGTYNVVLTAYGAGGSSSTANATITVYGPPIVAFTASPTSFCVPGTVTFTDQSQLNAPGAATYQWNFGTGTPGSGPTTSYTFSSAGSYNINLTVTNGAGCIASLTKPGYVTGYGQPNASFSASPTTLCNSNPTTTFTNNSSGPPPLSYTWIFGDNSPNSSATAPTHTYTGSGPYTVQLIVVDGIGCKDTATSNNYISVVTVPATMSGSTSVCVGQNANFTNTSGQSSATTWDYGDGNSGSGTTATHAYNTAGTYTVTMTNSYNGCSAIATQNITVNALPNTAYTINPAQPCPAPIDITFNPVQSGNSYQWYFGDGSSPVTGSNPTHTYANNGRYDIEVIASNSFGCRDTTIYHNALTIYPLHLAITDDVHGGCIPFPVNFSADAYYDAPLASQPTAYPYGVATYQWNFGDSPSSTSGAATPTHNYTTYGTYTVHLTVTTNNGCTVTDSTVIRAGTPDTANFSASPLVACVKQPIEFSNMSSGATNYFWYFGDGGQTTSQTPEYEYQVPGTYNVWLVAIKNGCPDTMFRNNYITIHNPKAQYAVLWDCTSPRTVTFDNNSLGVTSYSWDFGDGNSTTTTVSPTHTYTANGTYNVILTTHNDTFACTDTSLYHILISTPAASIVANDTAICVTDSTSFTANLGGGGVVLNPNKDYTWVLDNQIYTDTINHINHFFNTVGQMPVTVVIKDYRGCKDTARATMVIAKPTVSFTGVPTPICSPLPVNFTDQTTDAPTVTYTSRIWTWGDNNTTTGNNGTPTHSYSSAGAFTVKLVVTDNVGCKDSLTKTNYITVNKPHADFTVSNTSACQNRIVNFTSTSTGTPLTHNWSFGDGYTSNQQNPVHQYAQLGTYTIKLTITDNIGCTDSIIRTNYITVHENPVSSFIVSDTFSICSPLIDTFYNTSTGATSYQWDFGDGNSSSLDTAVNPYINPGLYNVALVTTNTYGCKDTAHRTVQVLGYAGLLTYTPLTGCAPLTVSFTANINTSIVPSFVYDFSDGTTVTSSNTSVTHTYSAPGPHVPRLILAGSSGCQSASLGLDTIRVDGLYQGFTFQPDPLCGKDTVTFTDTSIGAYSSLATTKWFFDDGQTANTAIAIHFYGSPASYPLTLVSTTTTGCVDTLRTSMIVYPLPNIYAGLDTTICLNDAAVLDPSGGVSYVWSPAASLSCTSCTNPMATPTVQTVYTVVGTDGNGCTNTDSMVVSIKTKTTGSVDTAGTEICQQASTQLHAHAANPQAHYQWTPASGLDNSQISDPVAAPGQTTDYTVIIQEGSCIPDTEHVTVTVYPLPDVTINPSEYKMVAGDSVQIQVSGTGIQTYAWTPAAGLSCDSCESPIAAPLNSTDYFLMVYSDHGCIDSAHAKVDVICDHSQVFMPNTFTPNGDGANDVFYPHGKGLKTIKSFRIYDRWGEMIFEKQNINLNEKDNGWDGTYKGSKLNADVYVYVVDAICDTGSPITWTGDIALLR